MPEENHSGVVSISGATSVRRRRRDVVDSASSWGNSRSSGQAAADRGSQRAHAGTVAAVVAGGFSAEPILEMGAGAIAPTGRGNDAAVVVAGMF